MSFPYFRALHKKTMKCFFMKEERGAERWKRRKLEAEKVEKLSKFFQPFFEKPGTSCHKYARIPHKHFVSVVSVPGQTINPHWSRKVDSTSGKHLKGLVFMKMLRIIRSFTQWKEMLSNLAENRGVIDAGTAPYPTFQTSNPAF